MKQQQKRRSMIIEHRGISLKIHENDVYWWVDSEYIMEFEWFDRFGKYEAVKCHSIRIIRFAYLMVVICLVSYFN